MLFFAPASIESLLGLRAEDLQCNEKKNPNICG